jgi:hypothetical protein
VVRRHLTLAEQAVWIGLLAESKATPTWGAVQNVAQGQLAAVCGTTQKSVSQAITVLEKVGLVKTVYQGGLDRDGNKQTGRYIVHSINKTRWSEEMPAKLAVYRPLRPRKRRPKAKKHASSIT